MRCRGWSSSLIGLIGIAAIGHAQPLSTPVGVVATPLGEGTPGRPIDRSGAVRRDHPLVRPDSAWWIPLASAVVPGFGQVKLRQSRFMVYAAAEAYAVAGYLAGEAAVRNERQRYLALARDIARAFVQGNDRVGDWDYYEAMEKHIESGVFDRTPGTGNFSPETDTTTFNGALWLRARQLSDWPSVNVEPPRSSPAYQAALSYYAARAVRPEFRWTWRNAQLEWDAYRQSIRRKNAASREAGGYLAVIALNHLLSTVDAYVTVRLRGGLGATRRDLGLGAVVPIP